MPIQAKCPNPNCGKILRVSDDLAGKRVKCPGCGKDIPVPAPAPRAEQPPVAAPAAPAASPSKATPPGVAPPPKAAEPQAPKPTPAPSTPELKVQLEVPATPPAPEDLLVGKRLAHYQILDRIALGGMGAIYRAKNLRLDKIVALKVLPQQLVQKDKSFAERFIYEARFAAKLEHPNVVTVYSVDFQENHLFIEMQYVPGSSLRQLIKDKKRLSPEEATRIVLEVARALAAAHAKGIVHRDVKPDNILITADGQVKVTDFGIAGIEDASGQVDRPKFVMGTPHYMSPEQCRGLKVDLRSDIYSLGATYFHALTGRFPFEGATPMAVVQKHVEAPLPSPRTIVPDIPESVCRVVAKMMAKDPGLRHQDCNDLIADLKAVAAKEGYKLETPEAEAQVSAPSRSARRALLAAAVVLLLLIGGAVAAYLTVPRAHDALTDIGMDVMRWLGSEAIPDSLTQPSAARPSAPSAIRPAAPAPPAKAVAAAKTPPQTARPTPPPPKPQPEAKAPPKPEEPKPVPKPAAPAGPPPHPVVASLSEIKIPPDMVYVPQGKSKFGKYDGTEEEHYLDAFFIDKYEVSNEQYAKFIADTNHPAPRYWREGEYPEGRDKYPVTGVSYNDAVAFAKWAGKRLPTALEWEKAARGQEGLDYPWGKEWDKWKAHSLFSLGYRDAERMTARRWLEQWRKSDRGREVARLGGMTVPVDRFEDAASPFKCLNMIGNVAEWTSTVQRTEPDLAGGERIYRVVCGGAWTTGREDLLTTYGSREYLAEDTTRDDIGFRCAMDAPNIQGGIAALKKAPPPRPDTAKETKEAALWPKDGIEREYAKFFKPLKTFDFTSAETIQKDGGQIAGNVTFAKGRTGHALIIQDPTAFVTLRTKLPIENGGLEFWLRLPPAEGQGVVLAGLAPKMAPGGFSVVLSPQSALIFTAEHGAGIPPTVLKDTSIGQPQRWVHVAVQWGQRKHRIYINGKLRQQDNAIFPLPPLVGLSVGAPHKAGEPSPLGYTAQPITIDGLTIFGAQ